MLKAPLKMALRVPVVGPAARAAYARLFQQEGRIFPIAVGPLAGMKYRKFAWSTADRTMVETNWETDLPGAFLAEIKGKRCLWDIGANWGFYTLLAARTMAPGFHIVAIEAHPRTARQLREQVRVNGIAGTEVIAAAVSDQPGTLEFTDSDTAQVQRLADLPPPDGAVEDRSRLRTIRVPAMTLDEIARTRPAPDLMKVDIEGAEMAALRGGMGMLKTSKPAMILETHSPEETGELMDLLSPLGYRFFTTGGREFTDRAPRKHLIART